MYINRIKYILTLFAMILLLSSFQYQPNIQQPFQEPTQEIKYISMHNTTEDEKYNNIYNETYNDETNNINKAPNKKIDWDNLPYDDYIWGWYYKQLWYLYHPNSTETPPWIKTMPLNTNNISIFFILLSSIYIILKNKFAHNKNIY